jgi:hypothetical protein
MKVIDSKNDGYVSDHEYSQGYSSYNTTDDIFKAIDLNSYRYNVDLLMRCMSGDIFSEGGSIVIELYEVVVNKLCEDVIV